VAIASLVVIMVGPLSSQIKDNAHRARIVTPKSSSTRAIVSRRSSGSREAINLLLMKQT
jgi:hypothetical protein